MTQPGFKKKGRNLCSLRENQFLFQINSYLNHKTLLISVMEILYLREKFFKIGQYNVLVISDYFVKQFRPKGVLLKPLNFGIFLLEVSCMCEVCCYGSTLNFTF